VAGRRASLGGQGDSAVAAPAAAGTIRHVTQALDKLTPDRDAPRWVLRGGSRWRTALYLGVLLAAFVAVNAFWRNLATGHWYDFHPVAYYHDLTTPLAEVFRHPLDVLSHPWMILVSGLLLGLVIFVPLVVAVLYRPLLAWSYVLAVALIGHAPVLALAVGIGCVLGGRSKVRGEMPFLATVLGLLPTAAYLTLSALAGVDAAAVMPVQRWALYAPFVLAFVTAVLAGVVVIGLTHLARYRQGVFCLLLLVLPIGPVATFTVKVGPDELDYALIVSRLQTDGSIFEDVALGRWLREHHEQGLNLKTARVRVGEDLARRRGELVDRCEEFLRRHPGSDRRASVMWLMAQARSLQLDESAFRAELVRYVSSFPLEESAEAWQALREAYPGSPHAALADWRLGELALRAVAAPQGRDPNQLVRQGDEHLRRAAERLREMFPAAADRQETPERRRVFSPEPDVPSRRYYRDAAEAVERLLWLVQRNGVLEDPASAEALAVLLDINPKVPDYYDRLKGLLDPAKGREKTAMGDNLKLAVALQTADVYRRAEMLVQLAKDVTTDAAIVANFELGKLALRTAQSRAIGLVEGVQKPEKHLSLVVEGPPNPYQQKAAELLASLTRRPKGGD